MLLRPCHAQLLPASCTTYPSLLSQFSFLPTIHTAPAYLSMPYLHTSFTALPALLTCLLLPVCSIYHLFAIKSARISLCTLLLCCCLCSLPSHIYCLLTALYTFITLCLLFPLPSLACSTTYIYLIYQLSLQHSPPSPPVPALPALTAPNCLPPPPVYVFFSLSHITYGRIAYLPHMHSAHLPCCLPCLLALPACYLPCLYYHLPSSCLPLYSCCPSLLYFFTTTSLVAACLPALLPSSPLCLPAFL